MSRLMSRTLFVAGASLPILAAPVALCTTAATPEECLGVRNAGGDAECSWLLLKGRCADSGGYEAKASPANCCASKAADSACEHKSAFLPDGSCALPLESPSLRSLSLSEMHRKLHLAFASYCPSQINSWSCGEHCDAVSGISEQSVVEHDGEKLVAFVAWDSLEDSVVLSFRGSQTIENWVANIDIFKTSPLSQYPEAELHEGWWNAWKSLKPEVLRLLNKVALAHSTTSVTLTGHSLGGALATNAAMDLKLNHGFKTSVVTFGAPRVGDYEYHAALSREVPVWRITKNDDLVVHCPPAMFGFYHPETEIHFPKSNTLDFKVCDGSGEDDSCANTCAAILTCVSVDDHLTYLGWDLPTCAGETVMV